MDFSSVPIIVICCYMIGEIYKLIFKEKEELYKLIPIITSSIGGVLGLVIFYTNPDIIFNIIDKRIYC